jgi:neuroligin
MPVVESTARGREPVECPPNATSDRPLGLSELEPGRSSGAVDPEQEEAVLLEKQYNSYSRALGVTVGVGCLLLVLNALIFSAIYYQRRKRLRRRGEGPAGGSPQGVVGQSSRGAESPPLKLSPELQPLALTLRKQPPLPPVRTSSNPPPPVATIKKRVQIQEISV